ncbi:MAG: ECF transporter S component [Clostridia bacterium]
MDKNAKIIAITAMFASLTIAATIFIKIPLAIKGYIHAGDIIIFVSCFFLRPRYAALSAGVGSMLADLMLGYADYMLPSLFIKAGMAFIAGIIMYKDPRLIKLIPAYLAGGLFMLSGYFVFEGCYFGWALAVANLPFASLQPAAGIIIGVLIVVILKRTPYIYNFRNDL